MWAPDSDRRSRLRERLGGDPWPPGAPEGEDEGGRQEADGGQDHKGQAVALGLIVHPAGEDGADDPPKVAIVNISPWIAPKARMPNTSAWKAGRTGMTPPKPRLSRGRTRNICHPS